MGTNLIFIRLSIKTLVWANQKTQIANLVDWRDKPIALSIVQARLICLTHFKVGNFVTFGAFVIASTQVSSDKSVTSFQSK